MVGIPGLPFLPVSMTLPLQLLLPTERNSSTAMPLLLFLERRLTVQLLFLQSSMLFLVLQKTSLHHGMIQRLMLQTMHRILSAVYSHGKTRQRTKQDSGSRFRKFLRMLMILLALEQHGMKVLQLYTTTVKYSRMSFTM